jgi:hypothetical protein
MFFRDCVWLWLCGIIVRELDGRVGVGEGDEKECNDKGYYLLLGAD